jgi:c-di-GMP-binding flagellar brake protein YcgR
MRVVVFVGSLETLEQLETKSKSIPLKEASLNDISGSGCSVTLNIDILVGESIVIDFSSAIDFASQPIKEVGRVECKVMRISSRDGGRMILHLEFFNIKKAYMDKIVRYVAQRDIELLRIKAK